jgi:AcrR family transcriptional regulator
MADSTFGEPDGDEVMAATAAALADHGYAGLTMQDVADRTELSKSTLHYRHDTKEKLLVAFVEHNAEQTAALFDAHADDPPLERLSGILGATLDALADPERAALTAAYLELHARAERNEAYREAIAAADRDYRAELADAVAAGVEAGVFRAVDPDAVAALLVAVPDSAALHRATLGQEAAVEQLRDALRDVVFDSLLAEDADVDRGELL